MRSSRFRITVIFAALALTMGAAAYGNSNSGFDTARLDRNCKPCDDFYQFANGTWLANNPVPNDYASWSSFNILADKNNETLRKILEGAAANESASGDEQKIGAFYTSCMDEARIEAEGIKPLKADFDRIDAIKNMNGLEAEIAMMHNRGIGALFGFGALSDLKNSSQIIGFAAQGGLSLPNRDYYLKDDERFKNIREEFLKYSARMFELLGESGERAAADAKTIMAVETKLAETSLSPVELRDPTRQYNKMKAEELKQVAPAFPWADYLAARGVSKGIDVNVAHLQFFKGMNELLASIPTEDWKTYLRWNLINGTAPNLSSKFENASFDFYGKTLSGTKQQQPRWKRCVAATNGALGDPLGRVYVAKAFSPESKAQMLALVKNLLAVFRENLNTLEWMNEGTRKQAFAKLDSFVPRIGYPDKWKDYSGLKIKRGAYAENAFRTSSFAVKLNLNKIGKPLDKTEWNYSPPTVNASYSPLLNVLTFPAGILQPPFFNPEADDALNYGAIGAVIGHEITHGFDDSGSRFDAQGNLNNWWTGEDRKNFDERASCVENQFSGFKVEEGLNVNGKLVLGESIADLGGVRIAFEAYKRSLAGKSRPKDIDGFTLEQRFFLGYAQIWAANYRPEQARLLTASNVHPLPKFRVNGPLSNLQEFAEAFGCKKGDAMVRSDRCRIW